MTKNDVKRLRGLTTVAGGSIATVRGELKTPEQMNVDRVRCLIAHWQEAGKEMLEILETLQPLQPDMFQETRPIVVEEGEFTQGRVIISPNGIPPREEVTEEK